jgi:hypothetical protein
MHDLLVTIDTKSIQFLLKHRTDSRDSLQIVAALGWPVIHQAQDAVDSRVTFQRFMKCENIGRFMPSVVGTLTIWICVWRILRHRSHSFGMFLQRLLDRRLALQERFDRYGVRAHSL